MAPRIPDRDRGEHRDRSRLPGVFQKKKVDVEAPEKEFFLYERCAHSPIYEDGERTREILNELLKAD